MKAFFQKEMLISMHLVYFQSKSNRSRMVDKMIKISLCIMMKK